VRSRYWETPRREGPSHQSEPTVCLCHHPAKTPGTTGATTDTSKPAKGNTGRPVWTDGKLTEVERERRRVKDSVYYCALSIDVGGPRNCRNPRHPKPPLLVGPPLPSRASLMQPSREVVEGAPDGLGKLTRDPSPQVCNLDRVVPQHTSPAVHEAPDPLVDSVRISAALTSHSEVSFLCSRSDSWHPRSDIGTHRLWCHLKLLRLFSGRLASLCN